MTPDFAVGYQNLLCDSLRREKETTKKVMAAIPEARRDYRLDPKARTAFELAWHLASSEVQMTLEVAEMKFTLEPKFTQAPSTVGEMVTWYDANIESALKKVQAMSPEQLMTPVDFYGVLNLPVVFYLGLVNNHSVHHRGQLSTYLRPMGSKIPQIYGGSADEPWE